MDSDVWNQRRITSSAQSILKQIPSRACDRGLHIVDGTSIRMLALWSVLLWERKVGLLALERSGADRFDLARGLDRLREENASEHPVAYDEQRGVPLRVKPHPAYGTWDFEALLEPLLHEAQHEASELGHDYVGSEHLVLAIVHRADPELRTLLQQHGVSHDRVKEAVTGLLHH
jgi:ATP-dependent Clp protease ATP-binding subunit ClpA